MFDFLNSRGSIGARLGAIAVCALLPIALLLYLFVAQMSKDTRFVRKELEGASYLREIWPAFDAAASNPGKLAGRAADAARDRAFHTGDEAAAFAAARPSAKVDAGVAWLRAVADGSNLTLDTNLSSFYSMDAATVKLPRLMAAFSAVSPSVTAKDRAFALGQAEGFVDAAVQDMDQAIADDSTGSARKALAARRDGLAAAFQAFRDQPSLAATGGSPALHEALHREIDDSWQADAAELVRLLRAREALLRGQLIASLSLVVLAVGLAALLMITTARGLTGRLRALLKTMDRLNANDTTVEIPYLSDRNEIGRIATTLEALKQGQIEAVEERRRVDEANAAVRDSEARLRFLTEHMTDLVMRFDRDGRRLFVSSSCRRFGYEPEELVGRMGFALSHPDDTPHLRSLIDKLFLGDLPPGQGTAELRILTKKGKWVWMEGAPTLIRNAEGEPIEFVWIMRDISARKAAEAALSDSEARYRMMADHATDVIVRYDSRGIVEYVSPAVHQMGYRPEQIIGGSMDRFVHPDDIPILHRRHAELVADRPAHGNWEARFRHADGEWVWFESSPAPILGADGMMIGAVTVLRNVSERKAVEAALREVNAELMRVARASALGAFASSVAHEVNQPLAAIVTNSEASLRWLANTPVNLEMAVEAINRTARDARRASDVVTRLRALVTKEEPRDVDFDLNEAIMEVLNLTQREQQLSSVVVAADLGKSLPTVRGDRIQFQQVILNLVLNAIEAMRSGPVKGRRLQVRSSAPEAGEIQVEVEDRGSGIDPAAAARIFDHLFTTKAGGTGLGLAISKTIIEAHGGRIWADQAVPHGAIIRFRIPHGPNRQRGPRAPA